MLRMYQSKRILATARTFALSCLVVLSLTAPGGAQTLRIAYNSSWPPYSYGEGANVEGLLVALTQEIIENRMGYKVVNVGLPWIRAQREVENGRLDALVTYASEARRSYSNASREVIYTLDTKAFVRTGSEAEIVIRSAPVIETHRQFKHCMILGDGWTKNFLEKNGIPYETGIDTAGCLRQVKAGRQDVFLHVVDTAKTALSEIEGGSEIVMLPKVYSSVPISLLVSKTASVSVQFLTKFDRILAAMKAEGSYHSIVARLRGLPEPIQLATLEWPPYTGETLSHGGAITEILRQGYAASGRDILPYFLPWKRAIAYAKSDQNSIVGYYPGYHCNHDSGFIASQPIGKSALGFAERSDNDIQWETLDDLEQYRIGTVIGYANTKDFDQGVTEGRLKVFTAHDDKTNLQNLAAGYVDLAAIDSQVMLHMMKRHPTLGSQGPLLRLDNKLLASHNLFLCVKDNDKGRKLVEAINRGLTSVDKNAVWQDFYLTESE